MDPYRSLFEHAPSAIIIADRAGRILEANPAALALPGMPGDARGRLLEEFAILREIGAADAYRRCQGRGVHVFDEGSFRRADGEKIFFQFNLMPVSGADMIHLVIDDTTDRVKAEEGLLRISAYFDKIFASISPLATLNADLSVRFVNDSFRQEFEIEPERTVAGLPVLGLLGLGAGDRKDFIDNVEESRRRTVQNCEFKRNTQRYGYSVFRFEEDIGIILKNITLIKKLERKIWNLHSRLLQVQEEERQRIASELHDSVGQTILGAKLNFQYFAQNPDQPRKQFQTGLELIDRASQELREIYTNLYPSTLRELGLEAAVREFTGNFLDMSGCHAELVFELERALDRNLETNLFRIIQEIFTNIFKHAGADMVRLRLRQEEERIVLTVEDNGGGFHLEEARAAGGFGLANMQRRAEDLAGTCIIESNVGEGSLITISVPGRFRQGI